MAFLKTKEVNRKSAYLYRILFSYVFFGVAIVRGVVLVPLYLKHVSVDLYGAWVASGELIAYLGMLDFGFAAVVNQRVAQAYGGKAFDRVASISATGLLIGIGLSGVVGVLGYYLASWVPRFLEVREASVSILTSAVRIQVIATATMLIAYFVSGVLIALQRTLVNVLVNFGGMIAAIALTIYGLSRGWGLISIPVGALTHAVIFLVGTSAFLLFVWKQNIGVRPVLSHSDFRSLSGLSGFVFLGKVSSNLLKRSDTVIVSKFMGPDLAAMFNLTARVSNQAKIIPGRIAGLIVPTLAHLVGEEGAARVKRVALDVLSVSVGIASVFAAGILALNRAFMHLWVGDHLFGGMALTVGVCIYFFLEIGRNALSNLLFGVGEIRIPSLLALGEAGLKIALVIGGVYWLGLWGVPLGSIIALLTINSVYLIHLFIRRFEVNRVDLRERFSELVICPSVAFGIGVIWYLWSSPKDWLAFVLNVLALGALLMIVLWLLNPSLRREIGSLMKSFLHRVSFKPAQLTDL